MIKIENIGKVFNAHSRNRNEVLKGVSFELPEKGFIAIYGKSGSGNLQAVLPWDRYNHKPCISSRFFCPVGGKLAQWTALHCRAHSIAARS